MVKASSPASTPTSATVVGTNEVGEFRGSGGDAGTVIGNEWQSPTLRADIARSGAGSFAVFVIGVAKGGSLEVVVSGVFGHSGVVIVISAALSSVADLWVAAIGRAI